MDVRVSRQYSGTLARPGAVVEQAFDGRLSQNRGRALTRSSVLALMAEGCSNAAISARLHIGERTVETVCAHIFAKLGLPPDRDVNRRVLAVIKVLRA